MRAEPVRLRMLGCAAIVSLLGVLPACDQIDVTSAENPPSARCASCHLPEYFAADHPPHRGVKPTTCATCHTQSSFHPARLEHSFRLDGAHAKADCFACHAGTAPLFEGTTKSCATCHTNDHARANASVAKHQSFGDDCTHCHGTTAWKPTLEARATGDEPLPQAPAESPLVPKAIAAPDSTTPSSSRRSPAAAKPAPVTPASPDSPSSKHRRPDSVSGASPAWKH
jgi:hypothetical protein